MIIKLTKIVVEMKHVLIVTLTLLSLGLAATDTLLKMGENNNCIKGVIGSFPPEKHCQQMDDLQKSTLAMRMSQCLLMQMGKSLAPQCLQGNMARCDISGQAWSTYSTFFAHIDNLCHFYWEILHHQRAERLISSLSESSSQAQQILEQNVQQTNKILQMQESLSESMQKSLQNQQEMSQLISDSSSRLVNMTSNMQNYIQKIHDDIDQNYGSLRNILSTINHSVSRLLSIQSFMTAEVNSIQGMLYFLCQFLAIMFVTSFTSSQHRSLCLMAFGINIALQLGLKSLVEWLIGVKLLRCLFMMIELLILASHFKQKPSIEREILNHLDTPRLQRIFNRALNQQKTMWMQKKIICYRENQDENYRNSIQE